MAPLPVDTIMIFDCTKPVNKMERNSIEPLVAYLRKGKPVTDKVRQWLIELLAQPARGEFRLEYIRRPGFKKTDASLDLEKIIYDRFLELDGKTVTRSLYNKHIKQLERRPKHNSEVSLTVGKKLTRLEIYDIIGAELSRSRFTVKQIVLKMRSI